MRPRFGDKPVRSCGHSSASTDASRGKGLSRAFPLPEALVSKYRDRPYRGGRQKQWTKVKTASIHRAIVETVLNHDDAASKWERALLELWL
jgi:ATP-dependent DNA ligase